MKRSILFCLFFYTVQFIFAQEHLHRKVISFYKNARFATTDTDKSGKLSKEEMGFFADEFVFFLTNNNFEKSDIDGDGLLNKEELDDKYESEQGIRAVMEKQAIRALKVEYLSLPIADKKYLKANPDLTLKLFANYFWMQENPFLVSGILEDKNFMKTNPAIKQSLYKNLIWLSIHPFQAQKLLSMKDIPSYIGRWKELQGAFIKENPNLKNSVYNDQSK